MSPTHPKPGESVPDDLERTQREFSLQVRAMTQGETFNASAAIDPFVRLLPDPIASPVIDLACGPGIVSAALARAGARVIGLDTTPAMLESARASCREEGLDSAEFRQGNAEALPFDDAHFAGAVTRLSIHHFTAPERALSELRRVLRRGATLVVGDIVASTEPAEAELHNALETLRDPSHQRLLSEPELRGMIEDAGFRVREVEVWANPKTFDEWAAIVEDARSIEPVRAVMRALAQSGNHAGIDLRIDDGNLGFTHHWRFIQALAV